jgi:hypothetical protein
LFPVCEESFIDIWSDHVNVLFLPLKTGVLSLCLGEKSNSKAWFQYNILISHGLYCALAFSGVAVEYLECK